MTRLALVDETDPELLTLLHRKWIETRDPIIGDKFSDLAMRLAKHSRAQSDDASRKGEG